MTDKKEFHHIVESFHDLTIPYADFVHKYDFGFMIKDENVVGYHIEENTGVYDYIYNEEECSVYISVDSKVKHGYKSLYKYLVDKGYYDENSIFNLNYCPLNKDDYALLKDMEANRPIIYLSDPYPYDNFMHKLKDELGELAYIIYGDKSFEQLLFNDIKLKGNCILYPNGDSHKISRLSKESVDAFIERIVYKLSLYTSKRVFAYPYKMNQLYQKVMYKMICHERESGSANELEQYIIDIEGKIKDLENKISELKNDVLVEKCKLENLEKRVNKNNKNPILFKGDIKEHYYMEQKDIVLTIIEEELKSEGDEHIIAIYKQILKDNPLEKVRSRIPSNAKDMNRAELLMNIEEALNNDSIKRVMEMLAKNCGFEVDKNGHNMTYFFGDEQCPLLFASSPSDGNFAWQMLRMAKKVCF